ncbi:MAG: hypothetical protein N2Z73_04750, partial [Endomicrobia bacterium]|nr:hypothetical protein [Endomicrobiia bacterium]
MRKLLGLIGIATLFFLASNVFADVSPGPNPDYGYVIVKCTAAIAINVIDESATAYFLVTDLSRGLGLNETHVSITSISIQNVGLGSICKWAVYYSTIQRNSLPNGAGTWSTDTDDTNNGIKAWTISTDFSNGLCVMGLRVVFSSRPPT